MPEPVHTDFIVVGSGISGLRSAISLAPSGSVTVLTKDQIDESNTQYAQGGIAVVLNDDDRIELHVQDTLDAGAGLCDEDAVKVLVEEGPGTSSSSSTTAPNSTATRDCSRSRRRPRIRVAASCTLTATRRAVRSAGRCSRGRSTSTRSSTLRMRARSR